MKFKIIFLLSAIVILASCNNSVKKEEEITPKKSDNNDWDKMNIKSNVKSIDERKYFYSADADGFKDKMLSRSQINFTENGLISEKSNYSSDNKLVYHEEYVYDSKGILDVIKCTNGDGDCLNNKSCKHDSDGRLIEQLDKNCNDEPRAKIEVKNNIEGRMSEVNYYNTEDETLIMQLTYSYDKNGFLIGSTFREVFNKIETKTEYFNDENGHEKGRDTHDISGKLTESLKFENELDKNLNWIKRNIIQGEEVRFIVEREIVYFE
jgi:hypothetical protein